MSAEQLELAGSFLIAMPGMADSRFAQSLVYICDHSEKGAMGLIVNKPAPDMALGDLLGQLEIEPVVPMGDVPVYFGGPVETGRGFVLHSSDYASDLRSVGVTDEVSLTPTLDVLEDIAAGKGPEHAMMMLGYAGWGPGQLEGEIANHGWLIVQAGVELLFEVSSRRKWARALEVLGVDPALLSSSGGSA